MKNKLFIKTTLAMAVVMFVAYGSAFAGLSTFTGTIQGANCVVHKTTCPIDNQDAHSALENDFVLLTANGDYYFMPNINRALKTRYVNKSVKINGEVKGHSIIVSDISVKTGNGYRSVWNWAEIVKSLSSGK